MFNSFSFCQKIRYNKFFHVFVWILKQFWFQLSYFWTLKIQWACNLRMKFFLISPLHRTVHHSTSQHVRMPDKKKIIVLKLIAIYLLFTAASGFFFGRDCGPHRIRYYNIVVLNESNGWTMGPKYFFSRIMIFLLPWFHQILYHLF